MSERNRLNSVNLSKHSIKKIKMENERIKYRIKTAKVSSQEKRLMSP